MKEMNFKNQLFNHGAHSIKFVGKRESEPLKENKAESLKHKFHAVYKKNLRKLNDPVIGFVANLREKYQDYEDYTLYHSLTGTICSKKGCSKYDFPGEDSVEKFIENLSENYK